jgi:two-component system, OmpR family, sensor histidine kinase BaeS
VRDSLLWRLLGAQLLVIAIGIMASGVMITDLATRSFMTIMARYNIEPVTVESEFLVSTHRILVASSLAAAVVAMLLGWFLVRRLVRPIERMMVLAEGIAQGNYSCRVETRGPDEIVRLSDALNRMAEGLQRVEALRRDLVANVAHELRTPLSTLQGYLEALRDGIAPPTSETLASLHEEVLRLVRLVDALHQLSQFDARVSRLRLTEVDLPELARRLLTAYGSECAHRKMAVGVVSDVGIPRVQADADLVSQALRNLLDNALRYGEEGTQIAVAISRRDGAVRVTVQNTGEGISAEDLPYIFERFYRGEKSRSRDTGGAGIGLALIREIARAHGGGAGAESAGGLTTVWFTLSLRPAARASPLYPFQEKRAMVGPRWDSATTNLGGPPKEERA